MDFLWYNKILVHHHIGGLETELMESIIATRRSPPHRWLRKYDLE
ncbi:hypothetical protein BTURTLESOX_1095 [bacterium endosymbiont of Bathymodiolus sp. 5 South]|nr:hypothetical protein BTURTLESOX_1095 [bacterium endosymbiont of Bathymodiolus sp. 5 South]